MLPLGAAEVPEPPPSPQLFRDYLDVRDVLGSPPPELDFVLPGLLRGTIGMLVSAGGTGKSMLTLQWAISVALGRDRWRTLGEDPRPGRVLFVNAEDPPPVIARRLHALIGDDPTVWEQVHENLRIKTVMGAGFTFGSVQKGRFIPSYALSTLEEEIGEFKPDLVPLDTLNRCLAGLDENDNGAMGLVVTELERVMAPVGAAALVLHHTSKAASLNGQGDRQESARGAGALTANARWAQNLVGMSKEEAAARGIAEDEQRHWVRMPSPKANYVPPQPERWLLRRAGGALVGAEPPTPRRDAGGSKRRKGGAGDGLPANW